MDQIELPLEPRHLGVPSVHPKLFSELMVRLAQTVHLSCTDTNTVSNQTKMRPTSPRNSIKCVQNDFQAYGTFSENRAPILR